MKYLLASLIAACLIGGIVSAKNEQCSPYCDNPGPQAPGAKKGDRYFPMPRGESSNYESYDNDTSHRKYQPGMR